MSKITGIDLYFKKEFLLHTGSFKERGARNTLMILPPVENVDPSAHFSLNRIDAFQEEKQRGVIAASAGNHALAISYHGQQLGIPVVVIMPKHAPIMKINNCRSFGAVVIVRGLDLGEVRVIRHIVQGSMSSIVLLLVKAIGIEIGQNAQSEIH
jgi:threonine dehydratase